MRRRGNNNNSAVANDEFTDAVHHDQAANIWPARAGFGSELGQPRLDLRFVRFVLELVDAAAVAAVVAGNSGEKNNGTTVGTMCPVERLGDGKRFVGQPNPVITRSRNLHGPIVLQPGPPASFTKQNGVR